MVPIRVLVISEDSRQRGQLSAFLRADPDCIVAGEIVAPIGLTTAPPAADVALVDVGTDPADAVEQLSDLSRLGLPAVALVSDRSAAIRGLAAGAKGVLARDVEAAALVAALRAAAYGLTVTDPELAVTASVAPRTSHEEGLESPPEALTPRELEVLQLISEGLSNRQIARRLGVTDHTVKFHLNTIFSKLDAHTRTEAVTRAARLGLIVL